MQIIGWNAFQLPLQLVQICWSDSSEHLPISPCLGSPFLYPHIALISWCPWWTCFFDVFWFIHANNSSLLRVALYGKKGLLLMFLQQPRVECENSSTASTARLRPFKDELIMDLVAQWHMLKRGESYLDSDLKHHDIAQLLQFKIQFSLWRGCHQS